MHSELPTQDNVKEGEDDDDVKGPTRRKRVTKACVQCQRSHLSCDSARPCQRCLNKGIANLCQDVKQRKRGKKRKVDSGECVHDVDLDMEIERSNVNTSVSIDPLRRFTYCFVKSPTHPEGAIPIPFYNFVGTTGNYVVGTSIETYLNGSVNVKRNSESLDFEVGPSSIAIPKPVPAIPISITPTANHRIGNSTHTSSTVTPTTTTACAPSSVPSLSVALNGPTPIDALSPASTTADNITNTAASTPVGHIPSLRSSVLASETPLNSSDGPSTRPKSVTTSVNLQYQSQKHKEFVWKMENPSLPNRNNRNADNSFGKSQSDSVTLMNSGQLECTSIKSTVATRTSTRATSMPVDKNLMSLDVIALPKVRKSPPPTSTYPREVLTAIVLSEEDEEQSPDVYESDAPYLLLQLSNRSKTSIDSSITIESNILRNNAPQKQSVYMTRLQSRLTQQRDQHCNHQEPQQAREPGKQLYRSSSARSFAREKLPSFKEFLATCLQF